MSKILFNYVGRPEDGFLPGVPCHDLDEAAVGRLPQHMIASVAKSGLYQSTKDGKSFLKGQETVADEPAQADGEA